jgi:hypothetical protein
LPRFIATARTGKHRWFTLLDHSVLPESEVVVIASDDAYALGVLTSAHHTAFSLAKGGWMGVGNDPRYQAECFSTFPFPDATDAQKAAIRALAEELDALRKRVIAEHAFLTMTRLYNVREKLKAGAALDEGERAIHEAGCVGVIHELHRRLDAAVAEAYGWPVDLPDEEVLARLVALNRERAEEERTGYVRWLRPDYQIPRFGQGAPRKREEQIEAPLAALPAPAPELPSDGEQLVAALRQELRRAGRPVTPAELARRFRNGRGRAKRIELVLGSMAAHGGVHRTEHGAWFPADRS